MWRKRREWALCPREGERGEGRRWRRIPARVFWLVTRICLLFFLNLFNQSFNTLNSSRRRSPHFLLTDSTVDPLYGDAVLAGFRKAQAEMEAQTKRSRAFDAELKASIAGFEGKLDAELGKWKADMKGLGERIDSRVRYFEETRQEANEKLRLVRSVVERLERRVEGALSEMEQKVGKAVKAQEQLELERIAPKGK